MTRLFIGYKPGVGGAVKVMRDNGDSPLATPNTNYGRFRFNSETGKTAYIKRFQPIGFDSSVGENSYKFYPSGTDKSNCYWAVWRDITLEQIEMVPGRMIGRSYPVICEARPYVPLGTKIRGPRVLYISDGTGGGNYVGHNIGIPASWMRLRDNGFAIGGSSSRAIVADIVPSPTSNDSWFDDDGDVLMSIIDLPADNDPIPGPSAGAPGSRNTIVRPTLVRIGVGGVNVDGGGDNILVDSTRIPVKIVRAGQVSVAAGGSTTITSPVTLTNKTFMDYMVWAGGTCTVPQAISGANVEGQNYDMAYTIYADRVVIHNDGTNTLNIRYMICMDDDRAATSGGDIVMRTLPGGHIQMKVPGSSDTSPGPKDILLDTRFAYLPIVAEGYLSYTEFTESPTSLAYGSAAKTINFPNDGSYVPFLKYYVKRNGNTITQPWAKVIRTDAPGPIARAWDNRASRDSTVAVVTNTSVKFHIARDNPYELNIDGNGNVEADNSNTDRVEGIRYYVFGIPTSL